MKYRSFFFLSLLSLCMIRCTNEPSAPTKTTGSDAPARATGERFYDVFTGDLPCDNCARVTTKLYLFQNPGDSLGTYRLRETYMDDKTGEGNTEEESGDYTVSTGIAGNPEALVYRLRSDDPGRTLTVVKANEQEVFLLKGNFAPSTDDPRFKLTKVGQELYVKPSTFNATGYFTMLADTAAYFTPCDPAAERVRVLREENFTVVKRRYLELTKGRKKGATNVFCQIEGAYGLRPGTEERKSEKVLVIYRIVNMDLTGKCP